MTSGAKRIADERATHPDRGYTLEHDLELGGGHLLGHVHDCLNTGIPTDDDLVAAGALIAAELDRRAAQGLR